jgi:polyisoprenoid-binding protein YceI
MKFCRLVSLLVAVSLALALRAADQPLKIDREKSFVDVDVKATMDSFTGRLEKYQADLAADEAGKVKTAKFAFRFADLKTGKADRDAKMLEWLGSADAAGEFELGLLALAPNGLGQVTGKLTFHGQTHRVEFPIEITRTGRAYTIKGEVTLDHRTWGLKVIRTMGVLKVDPKVKVRFQLAGELPEPKEE